MIPPVLRSQRLPLFVAASLALAGTANAQRILFQFEGSTPTQQLGGAIATAGDFNADGLDDVIVASPNASTIDTWNGLVEVYSGLDGTVLATFEGLAGGDKLGYSVSSAGDVDADGFADIIAGALLADRNGTNAGMARVYSGQTGAILHDLDGLAAGDFFGTSVAGLGDVDLDGFDDFAVGAPGMDGGGAESGGVMVFSGQTGAVLHTMDGLAPGDVLGVTVAGTSDVDGDGAADFTAGASGADPNGSNSGEIYVWSGLTGSLIVTFTGPQAGDGLGTSLQGTGDIDGDSIPDLIAGAPGSDLVNPDAGLAFVYTMGSQSILYQFFGIEAGERFGQAVAGRTDVDRDGFADVAVGAPLNDENGLDTGKVTVFWGQFGAPLYEIHGVNDEGQLGRTVSDAGELNGDGRGDFILGAPFTKTPSGNNSGLALVVAGQGIIGANYCTANVNSTGVPASIKALGSVFVGENDLSLKAIDMPAKQFGYFLASVKQGFFPNVGGGQGNLCLSGTIGRFTKQAQKAGDAGTFSIDVDLTDLPPPLQTMVLPGDTWYFQAWHRDKNPDTTSNLTDGVQIDFQ